MLITLHVVYSDAASSVNTVQNYQNIVSSLEQAGLYGTTQMSFSALQWKNCAHKCAILTPLMLMRRWGSPWVRLDSHRLFHAQEPLQTFKLIIYLRSPCLPHQAVALLLVPACAPVYIFTSHKANHVLIFQIRKATSSQLVL